MQHSKIKADKNSKLKLDLKCVDEKKDMNKFILLL